MIFNVIMRVISMTTNRGLPQEVKGLVANTKLNTSFLMKLPKTFLGLLIGITFGGIGGAIFAGMGFVPGLAWEEIFIFLGAIFGAIWGFTDES